MDTMTLILIAVGILMLIIALVYDRAQPKKKERPAEKKQVETDLSDNAGFAPRDSKKRLTLADFDGSDLKAYSHSVTESDGT